VNHRSHPVLKISCRKKRIMVGIVFHSPEAALRFQKACSDAKDGPMPPRAAGWYLLLSRNLQPMHGPGSHTVVYAGWSKDCRDRVVRHAGEDRYAKRFQGIGRWPSDVLFMLAGKAPTEICAVSGVEPLLHRLFVPRCSFEFLSEVEEGRRNGFTDQVVLDLVRSTLTRPDARCAVRAA
jgi:hypothetical protein